MFSLDNGKTMLPNPITTGDIETATALQKKAEDLLLEVADLSYKHFNNQMTTGKITDESIKKSLSGYLNIYKDDDNSSKMKFIIYIMCIGDAEGLCGDYLIKPFTSNDADIVITGCNRIIENITSQIAKLKALLEKE